MVPPNGQAAKTWASLAVQKDGIIAQQDELFHRTIEANEKLEAEISELKLDLQVWKKAYSDCVALSEKQVEETMALRKKVADLEGLKDQGPMVLTLIDGDGNIFRKELLKLGLHGGRQAAQLLTESIMSYIRDGSGERISRAQIWVYVFFNMKGLQQTLAGRDICTAQEFEAFVMGFNQANPRFTINDVHAGKEAADVKIKEYLLAYTRFPQTSRIFFGGGHDNDYLPTLTELQSEGLLEKIVLLQGYKDVASELLSLQLHTLKIEHLFMSEKISIKRGSISNTPLTLSPIHSTPAASYSKVAGLGVDVTKLFGEMDKVGSLLSSSFRPSRHPNPHLELHKCEFDDSDNVPPPCNFFYLATCSNGYACQYGHDYILTPEQHETLRVNAKKAPCPAVKKNLPCALGDKCPLGHKCPAGSDCQHLPRRKCWFKGETMHDFGWGAAQPVLSRE